MAQKRRKKKKTVSVNGKDFPLNPSASDRFVEGFLPTKTKADLKAKRKLFKKR